MKSGFVIGNNSYEVRDVEEPKISKPTHIKIAVESAAICNTTDNKIFATDTPEKNWPYLSFPFALGHECSGYIVEKGAEIKSFDVGDRVFYWTVDNGAFSQYLILDTESSVIGKLAEGVSRNTAAILEMVLGSARLIFSDMAEPMIKRGDKVAVIGAGPAGLIYLKLACLMGAKTVVSVARREFRLKKAVEMGADAAIDPQKEGYIDEAIKALNGFADVVIDTTGQDVVDVITAICKPDGILLPYGIPPFSWEDYKATLAEKNIIINNSGRDAAIAAVPFVAKWANEDLLKLEPIISHVIKLEDVGEGMRMCREERDSTLKIVIDINSNAKSLTV